MARVASYPRRTARAGSGPDFELLIAVGAWSRTVGLLAERELAPGVGLVIPRCASVHTIGMRFAIDVAFVRWPAPDDEPAAVLSVSSGLRPWRTARIARRDTGGRGRRQVAALELAAGEAARLEIAAGGGIAVAGLESPTRR